MNSPRALSRKDSVATVSLMTVFDSICASLWVTHVKKQIFPFHLTESLIRVQ